MGGHGGVIREGKGVKIAPPSVEEDVREVRQAVQRLESRLAEMDKKVDDLTRNLSTVNGGVYSLKAATGTDRGETLVNKVQRILNKVEG